MQSKSHKPKGQLIIETNLGLDELKLLQICRYYFSCYSQNQHPDPEITLELCIEKFGNKHSIEIAMSLLNVLSNMRRSRKSTFQYNSSKCKKCKSRISECERLLLYTIQFRRLGNKQSSYISSMILCEGYETDSFLKSIDILNNHLSQN